MTGERESNSRCPLCGGRLSPEMATIPFLLPDMIVLIREVPAEVCRSCREPYVAGKATDRITELLSQLRASDAEILIISFEEPQPAPALDPGEAGSLPEGAQPV